MYALKSPLPARSQDYGTLRPDAFAVLALILLQVLLLAVAGTSGEFPLNDGWVYAHSVRWLVDGHGIRLSDWTSPNLLPQVLLGGAASKVFGFGFETLRHLTQVVSIATSVAAFIWFRTCRLPSQSALLASLVIIAVPCWPVLASSFMSDIYGLLFALVAATFSLMCLRSGSWGTMAIAALASVVGVLERQLVIVVPFAFAAAWLTTNGHASWRVRLAGCVPLIAACVALIGYHAWLAAGAGVPTAQRELESRLLAMLLEEVEGVSGRREWLLSNIVSISSYLGLFLFGWVAWCSNGHRSSLSRIGWIATGGVAAAVALWVGWLPPYRDGFVIDRVGIGPFTLYDGIAHPLHAFDRSPGALWRVAGIAAMFGAAGFVVAATTATRRVAQSGIPSSPEAVFLLVLITGYLIPLAITDYFDRYLLLVLPFAIALCASVWPSRHREPLALGKVIGLLWVAGSMLWGTMATHDYFAWNSARWSAIHFAEARGATPTDMDGGYEYNGYFSSESLTRTPGKSWWWVQDDRWVVAFSPLPGYRTITSVPVVTWLARTPKAILLQERID